jgi:exopolysaccharide production protein ExoQ
MIPQVATFVCFAGILGLFVLDRDKGAKTSFALWIPVLWLSVSASQMLTEWLALLGLMHPAPQTGTAGALLEGSPPDRYFLTILVILALGVLVSRARKVGALLKSNAPILLFFAYCGLSIIWSDYPDVSFKRWIKAIGDVAMVLIILTDIEPFVAIKRVLSRSGFVLVPVSVLLIKFYTNLGRSWNEWGGITYRGVATSKNELGGMCLLFGLGSMWRICLALRGGNGKRRFGPFIANTVLLLMVLWLFWKANTITALSCFLMASTLIVVTSIPMLAQRRWIIHVLVVAMLGVAFAALFLNVGSGLVETVGRDTTLTGRTTLWNLVLGMTGNPLLGTGFESFWLGPRLESLWNVFWWHPNEAHNGYIEVFLNLGWIGLCLLALLVVTGYRNVMKALRQDTDMGSLRLAFFFTAIAYNFTESAIRIMHPIWIIFLFAIVVAPVAFVPKVTPEVELIHVSRVAARKYASVT